MIPKTRYRLCSGIARNTPSSANSSDVGVSVADFVGFDLRLLELAPRSSAMPNRSHCSDTLSHSASVAILSIVGKPWPVNHFCAACVLIGSPDVWRRLKLRARSLAVEIFLG